MEVGSTLAKNFVTAYNMAQHPIKGMLRQRDFFEMQVKPRLGDGRIAYVWVDALRFEMARELCRLLKDDFDCADPARHRLDPHHHGDRHGRTLTEGGSIGGRWLG